MRRGEVDEEWVWVSGGLVSLDVGREEGERGVVEGRRWAECLCLPLPLWFH